MSKVLIVLLALFSILALLTGCAQTSATPTTSTSATTAPSVYPPPPDSGNPTTPPGYPAPPTPEANTSTSYPALGGSGSGIQVVASDGTVKQVSQADLNDLPKVTVGSESGPKLTDVLQFANIFDFSTVTVTGSNGSKELPKAQVTDQVILSLANNSVALVIGGTNEQGIQAVTSIQVK